MSLDHARFVLLTLSLTLASGMMAMAHAQSMPVSDNAPRGGTSIYVCKDENGRVISSDQPIDACARRNMRELNRDGSVRRVLPPPLTRQQEREAAQQALVRQEQERALKAQQAHDRHLLLTYKTPEDLRKRQEQQIQLIDEEISAAMRRILVLDQNLKEEREQAAAWQKKQDRPNPRRGCTDPGAAERAHAPEPRFRGQCSPTDRAAGPPAAGAAGARKLTGSRPDPGPGSPCCAQPSFFFSSSLTCCGLALPLLSFMT